MTIKIKNPEKRVVYVGELSASKTERSDAITGLSTVFTACLTKEISIPENQLASLKALQQCLLELRPAQVDEAKTDKGKAHKK